MGNYKGGLIGSQTGCCSCSLPPQLLPWRSLPTLPPDVGGGGAFLTVLTNSWLSFRDTHSMGAPPVPVSACCTRHAVARTQSAQPAILPLPLTPLPPIPSINADPSVFLLAEVLPTCTALLPSDHLPLPRIMPEIPARLEDASRTMSSSSCGPFPLPMAALDPGPSPPCPSLLEAEKRRGIELLDFAYAVRVLINTRGAGYAITKSGNYFQNLAWRHKSNNFSLSEVVPRETGRLGAMAAGDIKKTNGEEDGSAANAHPASAVPASDDVEGESSAPAQQHDAAGDGAAAAGGGDPAEAPAEQEEAAPKGTWIPTPRPPPRCGMLKTKEKVFSCSQPG